MDYNFLMEKAKEVSEKAYAPYSNFRVGACVLAQSGNVYTGCNVENSSYGLSMCAERCAIANAISSGEKALAAIAIYSPNSIKCLPCGSCRQVIYEFQQDSEVDIITRTNNGYEVHKINDLLPEAFKL